MKINRESVAIKGIERTIIDEAYENGWVQPTIPTERKNETVAIVGSGRFDSADELNKLGYNVTVYERAHEAGGLLMYGIPNMKLDKDVIRRRIKIMQDSGIEFVTDTEIGVDISREELNERHDAIILCTGSQNARDLPLEGRMGQGIHFAMDYLTEQMQVLNGELSEPTITVKAKMLLLSVPVIQGQTVLQLHYVKIASQLFNLTNTQNNQKK